MQLTKRIKLIFLANNLFFLTGIIISFTLWLHHQNFPIIPVFANWPILMAPFDLIIILTLIGLLVASAVYTSKSLTISLALVFLILMLQDQMRWQPWVYHFSLFLLPFCFFPIKNNKNVLSYFQLILIAIYLWSGIHKLNPSFITNVLPVLVGGTTNTIAAEYMKFGYLIPLVEISIAAGLFFRKTRNVAVGLGMLSHLLIVIWLSPNGGNTNIVVLPWNLGMMSFLYLCFYKVDIKRPYINFPFRSFDYLKAVVLVLVFLMPILNIWGYWDHYLSFNLYSGKNKAMYVAVEESSLPKMPYEFRNVFLEIQGLAGGKIIDMNKWALQELHVPIPPDERIFKRLAKPFCALDIDEDKIMILTFEQPVSEGKYTRIHCTKTN